MVIFMQKIKLVFVSNYINHHQLPISKRLASKEDIDYTFIQTERMEEERVKMGWAVDVKEYPFVKCFYEDDELCRQLIMDADVVIFGGTDDENYILPRLEAGKKVIRYSERIYKDGQWKFISPRGLKKKYHDHIRFNKSPVYLLCSGAYVASDFNLIHAYPGKKLRWGYFPEFIEYSEEKLFQKKSEADEVKLLWTGRMIDWKHPESAVEVARYLEEKGISYRLTMLGEGPLRNHIDELIVNYGLEKNVQVRDFANPAEVRELMLSSDIYLFTSDYKEGWGAVLNESMNSGCAVIASSGIGAVPYMLKDGKNGYVYKTDNIRELQEKAYRLAGDREEIHKIGLAAYNTVKELWNPETAAGRLYEFVKGFILGDIKIYEDGPLSMAPNISPAKGYSYTL